MDDQQETTDQNPQAEPAYVAPEYTAPGKDVDPQIDQGWSASGEPTDGSFILGYN